MKNDLVTLLYVNEKNYMFETPSFFIFLDYPLATEYAKSVNSLPMYYGMTDPEIDYIILAINNYQE